MTSYFKVSSWAKVVLRECAAQPKSKDRYQSAQLQDFQGSLTRNFPHSLAVQLNRKKRRSRRVHSAPLVHPLCTLLAAGSVGADRLPVYLAIASAVPNCRRSRTRSAGAHLPGDHAAV